MDPSNLSCLPTSKFLLSQCHYLLLSFLPTSIKIRNFSLLERFRSWEEPLCLGLLAVKFTAHFSAFMVPPGSTALDIVDQTDLLIISESLCPFLVFLLRTVWPLRLQPFGSLPSLLPLHQHSCPLLPAHSLSFLEHSLSPGLKPPTGPSHLSLPEGTPEPQDHMSCCCGLGVPQAFQSKSQTDPSVFAPHLPWSSPNNPNKGGNASMLPNPSISVGWDLRGFMTFHLTSCDLCSRHPHLSLHTLGTRAPMVHPEAMLFVPVLLCSCGWSRRAWLFSRSLKTQLAIISSLKAPRAPSWLGLVLPYVFFWYLVWGSSILLKALHCIFLPPSLSYPIEAGSPLSSLGILHPQCPIQSLVPVSAQQTFGLTDDQPPFEGSEGQMGVLHNPSSAT